MLPRVQGPSAYAERPEHLTKGSHSELVATFDTRVAKVRHLPGSAAKGAAKVALKLGYEVAAQAEGFYVEGRPWPAD